MKCVGGSENVTGLSFQKHKGYLMHTNKKKRRRMVCGLKISFVRSQEGERGEERQKNTVRERREVCCLRWDRN